MDRRIKHALGAAEGRTRVSDNDELSERRGKILLRHIS